MHRVCFGLPRLFQTSSQGSRPANTGLLLVLALAFVVLPLRPAAAGDSFQFAWLSDTHVGSTTGEEDLRAPVRDINSQSNLSFVIISGDVTEYGSREQLQLA